MKKLYYLFKFNSQFNQFFRNGYYRYLKIIFFCRYEESEAYEKKGDRDPRTFLFIIKQLVNANKLNHSTKLTSQIVTCLVFCYSKDHHYIFIDYALILKYLIQLYLFTVILCICTATLFSNYLEEISAGKMLFIIPIIILIVALLIVLCFIYLQPVSGKELTFSVPLVPFLPGFSILINIYLMMMLDVMTWIRFVIWMVIGKYIIRN